MGQDREAIIDYGVDGRARPTRSGGRELSEPSTVTDDIPDGQLADQPERCKSKPNNDG
jgi:hypothetical protein